MQHIEHFVFQYSSQYASKHDPRDGQWTNVAIGVVNAGAIRGDLDVGEISIADVLTILPFGNSVDILALYGKSIRKLLEKSVALLSYDSENTEGGFIQVSGKQIKSIGVHRALVTGGSGGSQAPHNILKIVS